MDQVTAVENFSLARSSLTREIVCGELKVGAVIDEKELGRTSRIPQMQYREAVISLMHRGLIVRRSDGDAIVTRVLDPEYEAPIAFQIYASIQSQVFDHVREWSGGQDERCVPNAYNALCSRTSTGSAKAFHMAELEFHEAIVKLLPVGGRFMFLRASWESVAYVLARFKVKSAQALSSNVQAQIRAEALKTMNYVLRRV